MEVPADQDLLTWLVPYATSMHRRFSVGRDVKTAWEGALFLPWRNSVSECVGCLCSHPTVVWALWIHELNKEDA